jgi:alpha-L-fucosidase 2
MSDLELWYTAPAAEWTEALPVGNGRLGAMVFGGIKRERLQLNEETLWTGGPYSPVNTDAQAKLRTVRSLIFEERYTEAEELAERFLMARPLKQMSFQPLGDFWIEQLFSGEVGEYRRSLNLSTAIAETQFRAGGVKFRREVFASAADGIVVISLSANQPASLSVDLRLGSGQDDISLSVGAAELRLLGRNRAAEGIDGALTFVAAARIFATGGHVETDTRGLVQIRDANGILVLLDAGTSFVRFDDVGGDPDTAVRARLSAATARTLEELRTRHVAEHQRLFNRLSIDLGPAVTRDLPTNERVTANVQRPDPALAALYVQFARYLMISSSRPGTQPANLQGLWNDQLDPPWGSKYTTNINLQMNYWLADLGNLSECFDPLIKLVEDVSETGREMATAHYGARGWVLHHNTDLWRATGPVDGARWGVWPTGGAWLCAQLWDHAAFRGRPDALVHRLYPLLAGAVRFVLDTLVQLPGTDYLVTCPSASPENEHPKGSTLCAGPAMDRQLIRDLFDAFDMAARQVGIDNELLHEMRRARLKLAPDRVGRNGQLQEWLEDWDMSVPEIHHRHVSHLYGLYPSQQIHVDQTPELAGAVRRSLEIRGDNATGWGIGWRINLWARLRDGERAQNVVQRLLSPQRTYPNLLDAHPPFQIDGNFGGAAGILEMLVQSDEETIHLLPALPRSWPVGRLSGVRCRGDLTLDLEWSEMRVTKCKVVSGADRPLKLKFGTQTVTVALTAAVEWTLAPSVMSGGAVEPNLASSTGQGHVLPG